MAPRALASMLPKVTRPALAKRGAAFAALIADWNNVVGAALAELSMPERLSRASDTGPETGGVLTIRVATGGAALEFQHLQSQIVERLNGYLGFRAVARIVFRQAPLPSVEPAPPRPAPPRLPAETVKRIAAAVGTIEDAELKSALERLGQAIAGLSRQIDEE